MTVPDRVPDHVVEAADELLLVDLTPRELRERLIDGKVYPSEVAARALRQFFREGNLICSCVSWQRASWPDRSKVTWKAICTSTRCKASGPSAKASWCVWMLDGSV